MKALRFLPFIMLTSVGCGQFSVLPPTPNLIPTDNLIVKARSYVTITMEKESVFSKFIKNLILPGAIAASSNTVVNVVVASNTQFNVNGSGFNVPLSTITDTLSFGNLVLNTLRDNNLEVCGVGNDEQCALATLRIYTLGSGDGLWNTSEGYGAPIKVTKVGVPTVIGLTAVNAVIMDTFVIAPNEHVIHLNDFTASKTYPITSDFSNAGIGTYSTTIVVEYGLSL